MEQKSIIEIKNFSTVETIMDLNLVDENNNKVDVPILIITIDSEDLPWTYDQWDEPRISYSKYELSLTFLYKKTTPQIIIEGNNFDSTFYYNLEKYEHIIFNISNPAKENIAFYINNSKKNIVH